jgi:hypothetical protein
MANLMEDFTQFLKTGIPPESLKLDSKKGIRFPTELEARIRAETAGKYPYPEPLGHSELTATLTAENFPIIDWLVEKITANFSDTHKPKKEFTEIYIREALVYLHSGTTHYLITIE